MFPNKKDMPYARRIQRSYRRVAQPSYRRGRVGTRVVRARAVRAPARRRAVTVRRRRIARR